MNVLVLCGGRSAERDVSCVSAAAILRNLPAAYRPLLVRIDPEGRWAHQRDPRAFARHPKPFEYRFEQTPARLEPAPSAPRTSRAVSASAAAGPSPARLSAGSRSFPVDVVFPALHGPIGEDGTLQGYLELLGVPYVGCGVLGSAVGMDKEVTKRLAVQAGLPVLPYAVLEGRTALARLEREGARSLKVENASRAGNGSRRFRFPVFVKPARLGSSVGVYKVQAPSGLAAAARRAFRFDTTVIIEQGVPAREIECAVLGGGGDVRASTVGEIRPNAEFYSYEAKYLDPQGAELVVPAGLPARHRLAVQEMAVRAFKILGCYGLARVDFLLDRSTGKLWFNEINTLPGFTSVSMYPKLWEASGLPFSRLVDRLIRLALLRHRARSRLRRTRD